jgi:hypothetical protein
MGGGQPRLFYGRRCHAPGCGVPFFICRSCYRGQRYCSDGCRQASRREQRRAANRRHQQSDDGRLDHRDRQRAYRQRRLRVTDQGCALGLASGSIAPPGPTGRTARRRARRPVCCIVCGRRGRLIEMFKRRE